MTDKQTLPKKVERLQNTSWGSKRPTIDLQRVPPHLLTSSFFHAFLKFFQDVDPDLLPEARRIQWITEFPFQQELISTFVLEPTFV